MQGPKFFCALVSFCLVLTIISVVYANPISEISRNRARQDIKRELKDRYGSSYSTIEMLLKSNMEDYDKLCDIPDTSVNNKILKDLKERYYPSFSTILMLFKSNKESYENLH